MIIDCNVGFGPWPFARFAEDTPARLAALLTGSGIDRALVSSTQAVLYEEPAECNGELEKKLRRVPGLFPVPVVNPRVASAASIMSRKPAPRAFKLIPNYHGYSLWDERAGALCTRAAERGIPVLIQMRVEDERSHYELMRVPGVPVADIIGLARRIPGLTVVALCPYFGEAAALAAAPGVFVDISFAEVLDTLRQLCDKAPAEKIVFGSHAPWLYPQAAVAKLKVCTISDTQREDIGWRTASRIFGIT
jgi:predicted TIM-barrel fold metal-dependent hydrolase